jgi:invasion protein IalB
MILELITNQIQLVVKAQKTKIVIIFMFCIFFFNEDKLDFLVVVPLNILLPNLLSMRIRYYNEGYKI